MALTRDCCAPRRAAPTPEKYVFTSNLLVRRDVFDAEPFDDGFVGWGWEDVEWGMRVAAPPPDPHIDNTATHLGLDAGRDDRGQVRAVGRQFRPRRQPHRSLVQRYPSYRAARLLKRLPLRPAWRPVAQAPGPGRRGAARRPRVRHAPLPRRPLRRGHMS